MCWKTCMTNECTCQFNWIRIKNTVVKRHSRTHTYALEKKRIAWKKRNKKGKTFITYKSIHCTYNPIPSTIYSSLLISNIAVIRLINGSQSLCFFCVSSAYVQSRIYIKKSIILHNYINDSSRIPHSLQMMRYIWWFLYKTHTKPLIVPLELIRHIIILKQDGDTRRKNKKKSRKSCDEEKKINHWNVIRRRLQVCVGN